MRSEIFDIKIDKTSRTELNNYIIEKLKHKNQTLISFLNPEIIYHTRKNERLKYYLNNITSKNYIDGIGIILLKLFDGVNLYPRITGTDFMKTVTKISNDFGYSIFLLGGEVNIANRASIKLNKMYPKSNFIGTENGFFDNEEYVVNKINKLKPDILVVCLGFPKQEEFILKNLSKLNATLIFGNGGALDYYSGKVIRAPKFIQFIGFEWLWRLFQDFNHLRIKRQLKYFNFVFDFFIKKLK